MAFKVFAKKIVSSASLQVWYYTRVVTGLTTFIIIKVKVNNYKYKYKRSESSHYLNCLYDITIL